MQQCLKMGNIGQEEKSLLSRNWKVFQAYSLQIALGCLSAFLIMGLEKVKEVFADPLLVPYGSIFYAVFFALIVVTGIIAFIFSGGIGLLRLFNAKRILTLMEKEEEK